MNLDQAGTLARQLIDQHLGRDWRLEWNDSDRLFGGCQANRKAIQLSRHFAKRCNRDEVLDTILHEIAHGLAPGRVKPHGREWRAIAERLGARPEPCKDTLFSPHLARIGSHRREWVAVAAALILIAAIVFIVTSPGPGPKPQQSLGTAPALAASNTTTSVPVTTLNLPTTTTSAPPTIAAPPPTTASPPRTTTIRTTAKQTPRATTTTAPAKSPPPAPPPTTTTTAPPPPVTTTTFSCTRDAYGNCYVAEENCPSNLYNETVEGTDGPMTCTQISGSDWQWEYS